MSTVRGDPNGTRPKLDRGGTIGALRQGPLLGQIWSEGGTDTVSESKSEKLSETVAYRIEERRLRLGLSQQAIAEGAWMARTSYVNKITATAKAERLSIDQAQAIADYFERVTGEQLVGWPFVEEATARELGLARSMLKKR